MTPQEIQQLRSQLPELNTALQTVPLHVWRTLRREVRAESGGSCAHCHADAAVLFVLIEWPHPGWCLTCMLRGLMIGGRYVSDPESPYYDPHTKAPGTFCLELPWPEGELPGLGWGDDDGPPIVWA